MYLEELKKGTVIKTEPAKIVKERMLEFARLYDNIPLHTDEEYARGTIFGGLIAPGVMSFMTVWAKYLEKDLFGSELIAGKSTKIEWLKPVYPDDTLTAEVEVTDITPRNEKSGTVALTLKAYNQNGVLVLTNVTEAIVKRKLENKET